MHVYIPEADAAKLERPGLVEMDPARGDEECLRKAFLSDRQQSMLQKQYDQLVQKLTNTRRISDYLHSVRAITQEEKEDIQAASPRYKQVQVLLNIIENKSQFTYQSFLKVLVLSNQTELAQPFGGIPGTLFLI